VDRCHRQHGTPGRLPVEDWGCQSCCCSVCGVAMASVAGFRHKVHPLQHRLVAVMPPLLLERQRELAVAGGAAAGGATGAVVSAERACNTADYRRFAGPGMWAGIC